MNHTIKITAKSTPPFDYHGGQYKAVKKKHKLRWKCTNAHVAILFAGDSPFETGEKVIAVPKNTDGTYLTIRPAQNNQIEVLKYSVVGYVAGQLVVDDPVIIIDNDGGGGGGLRKKVAKKKSSRKKSAKK